MVRSSFVSGNLTNDDSFAGRRVRRRRYDIGNCPFRSAKRCGGAPALDLAGKIAARAPFAMQQGKALVRATSATHQMAHLAMEHQAFAGLFGSAVKVEGVLAFLERP